MFKSCDIIADATLGLMTRQTGGVCRAHSERARLSPSLKASVSLSPKLTFLNLATRGSPSRKLLWSLMVSQIKLQKRCKLSPTLCLKSVLELQEAE